MSLRTLIEGFITAAATDIVKLTKFTTGSNSGTDLSALQTVDKTSLPAAINAVLAIANQAAGAAGASIDDSATSTSKTWSSFKTNDVIATSLATLVNSAPGTLDQLSELAAAIGNDPNFAVTLANSLAKRLRVDAAQTFTGPEKVQGISNLGAIAASDVGDTTTSLVAFYTAAKSA